MTCEKGQQPKKIISTINFMHRNPHTTIYQMCEEFYFYCKTNNLNFNKGAKELIDEGVNTGTRIWLENYIDRFERALSMLEEGKRHDEVA